MNRIDGFQVFKQVFTVHESFNCICQLTPIINSFNSWFLWQMPVCPPSSPIPPNSVSIGSVIFAVFTGVTDRQTTVWTASI